MQSDCRDRASLFCPQNGLKTGGFVTTPTKCVRLAARAGRLRAGGDGNGQIRHGRFAAEAPGSGLAICLPPAVVTRNLGLLDHHHASGEIVEREMQPVSRGKQRGQHCIVADIAQCKVDEPGAISACGHETLKVVVLGTDHEVVLSRVSADLRVGRPLQPQQRQLAGARIPSL